MTSFTSKQSKQTTVYRLKATDGDGSYLIGDLGYLYDDHDRWLKLLNQGFLKEDAGVYPDEEHEVFMCGTGGDGFFGVYVEGEKEDTLPVDAGLIGIMPWDLALETIEEVEGEEVDATLLKNHLLYQTDEDIIEIEVREDYFIIDGSLHILRSSGLIKEMDNTLEFD